MPTDADLYRTIGQLEQEVKMLTTTMTELKTGLADVQKTLSEARGGWRTLLLVGGAFSAIGAIIGKFSASLTAFFSTPQ
jgi:prefoldin subunit 5